MGPVALITGLVVTITLLGGEEAEWPCYHGPQRDKRSAETGLLKTWPKDGPELVWTASGLGHGYSSVSVAGGRLFTAGMIEKETFVTALDRDGKVLWRRPNGESWQASKRQRWAVPYAGSRGTPTVAGDTVFHLSELGRLTAFDARSGQERWRRNLLEAFEAKRPKYGFSESVLIREGRLFCCPGGQKGHAVALDKQNGKTLWAKTDIADPIGYSSFVVADIAGVEQLISLSAARVFAVRADTGQLLWEYGFANARNNNATDVVVHGGLVYASSGYGKGSVLLRPQRQADGRFTVAPVWSSDLLDNHHGGVVLVDGHLYGAGHRARGWFCLELKSGDKRWQAPGKGALTYADGHLYCLDEKGLMSLVRATPKKWDVVSSFTVPRGGEGAYWAHPVVCGGRLYVRHSDRLYAYQVRDLPPMGGLRPITLPEPEKEGGQSLLAALRDRRAIRRIEKNIMERRPYVLYRNTER